MWPPSEWQLRQSCCSCVQVTPAILRLCDIMSWDLKYSQDNIIVLQTADACSCPVHISRPFHSILAMLWPAVQSNTLLRPPVVPHCFHTGSHSQHSGGGDWPNITTETSSSCCKRLKESWCWSRALKWSMMSWSLHHAMQHFLPRIWRQLIMNWGKSKVKSVHVFVVVPFRPNVTYLHW